MAQRFTRATVDWAKLAERVSESQKTKFLAFRARSDGYMRRMMALPENPPKIDWAYYQKSVPLAGMVDSFKKQYESLKIPYPSDTVSSLIDSEEQEVKKAISEFKRASEERITDYQKKIDEINAMVPYEHMTMEDFADAHPDLALDPLNKPTFFPHQDEDQPGYKHDDKGGH